MSVMPLNVRPSVGSGTCRSEIYLDLTNSKDGLLVKRTFGSGVSPLAGGIWLAFAGGALPIPWLRSSGVPKEIRKSLIEAQPPEPDLVPAVQQKAWRKQRKQQSQRMETKDVLYGGDQKTEKSARTGEPCE